jgi:hypothetical protein
MTPYFVGILADKTYYSDHWHNYYYLNHNDDLFDIDNWMVVNDEQCMVEVLI